MRFYHLGDSMSHFLKIVLLPIAWTAALFLSQVALGSESKSANAASKRAPTRVVMDGIFSPLTVVLPLSFDAATFEGEKNRAKIKTALKELSDHSTRLRDHAKGQDRAFEFIAASLSRDAKDIYRWYVRGSYGESRYLLHNLTENCIACHSRLPERSKFPGAEQFFKNVNLAGLSAVEQAQLQTATRQFDAALSTYEKLFSAPASRPAEFVMMDVFTDYLKLCLRVKEDVKRPVPVLEKLAQRKDLPKYVSLEVTQWLQDLKQFESNPPAGTDDLAIGRSLIETAQKRMQFRMDRSGLVEYILASKYLNRFVGNDSLPKAEGAVAEAYYLLGVTESMIGRSYWLSQTEFYLETAVRLAPRSGFAEKAYAMLEEQVVLEYSGSSGTHVPEDVQQTLNELRLLLQAGK